MISPHHDSDLNPACIFHFPIDLERIVFEQAAYRDQKTALQLARVARRVCYWVEPLIYEYIPPAKTEEFLNSLVDNSTAKPLDFYAAHVKAICITSRGFLTLVHRKQIHIVLEHFVNLKNIALWLSWEGDDENVWRALGKELRPQRFSCQIEEFFGGGIRGDPLIKIDFGHPFFSRLTHLDVLDSVGARALWKGLESLPCLTHLSFAASVGRIFSFDILEPVKSFLSKMLEECPTLEVILFFHSDLQDDTRVLDRVLTPQRDARYVVLPAPRSFHDDWEAPFLGQSDVWLRAEEKVREQRAKAQASV